VRSKCIALIVCAQDKFLKNSHLEDFVGCRGGEMLDAEGFGGRFTVGANSLAMSALSVVPVHSQEIPSIKSMG
jgi:hypothetical protein